jgi:hypothetical protein
MCATLQKIQDLRVNPKKYPARMCAKKINLTAHLTLTYQIANFEKKNLSVYFPNILVFSSDQDKQNENCQSNALKINVNSTRRHVKLLVKLGHLDTQF